MCTISRMSKSEISNSGNKHDLRNIIAIRTLTLQGITRLNVYINRIKKRTQTKVKKSIIYVAKKANISYKLPTAQINVEKLNF